MAAPRTTRQTEGTAGDPAARKEPAAHTEPEHRAEPEKRARGEKKPETARYRVLAPCRLGCFREIGEIVSWPRFAVCPGYLEEAGPEGSASGLPPASTPDPAPGPTPCPAPGPTADDMFGRNR